MRYLLDTNVISEIRRVKFAHPSVLRWFQDHPATDCYLSVATIFELELGYERLQRRDERQAVPLRFWLDQAVYQAFGDRIFDMSINVAQTAAKLHVPDPRPDRDAFIAATALVHNLTLVTRNTRDFEPMGVRLINPWLI